MSELGGRVVLVTGASSGLGREIARACARAGADLAVTGRDEDRLKATAEEVRGLGRRCWEQLLEVTDSRAVESAAESLWDETGGIDALFNNAGANFRKAAVETTDEEWTRVIHTNLDSVFYSCRSFGRRMLERGRGKVINIASNIGISGERDWAAYASAKGAVITLTKTLAWEWAPGVTVNAIAPGPFHTEMNKRFFDVPEINRAVAATIPLGHVGKPEYIGPLAVLMAGAGSDYMTGSVVRLDGGVIGF